MDVAEGLTITAKALTAAQNVFDYFSKRVKTADDMKKLMELQNAFQALRDEVSRLHDELQRLKARGRYEQRQIGNAVVLVRVGDDGKDGPPCCPQCRDADGQPLPLQGLAGAFRSIASHRCTSCNGTFNL